jgi:hypothetical protein
MCWQPSPVPTEIIDLSPEDVRGMGIIVQDFAYEENHGLQPIPETFDPNFTLVNMTTFSRKCLAQDQFLGRHCNNYWISGGSRNMKARNGPQWTGKCWQLMTSDHHIHGTCEKHLSFLQKKSEKSFSKTMQATFTNMAIRRGSGSRAWE